MNEASPALWVVIPAAGVGSRMGAALPKQYLEIQGKPVIWWTLQVFAAVADRLAGIVVALSADDQHWREPSSFSLPVYRCTGGKERADSVLSALQALQERAAERDWVLVHDAARPCLSIEDLTRLINELADDPVGGLLAAPVSDTLKRADAAGAQPVIDATVSRDLLWRALTPQMFRFGALLTTLETCQQQGLQVTDEAQAMEFAGHRPRLVEAQGENLKITRPADLARAEYWLAMNQTAQSGASE